MSITGRKRAGWRGGGDTERAAAHLADISTGIE